jgi:hypothetical protein
MISLTPCCGWENCVTMFLTRHRSSSRLRTGIHALFAFTGAFGCGVLSAIRLGQYTPHGRKSASASQLAQNA